MNQHRVATVRKNFLGQGKLRNFIFSQGNLEEKRMKKIREKSGKFKIFQKSCKLTGFWKCYFP